MTKVSKDEKLVTLINVRAADTSVRHGTGFVSGV